jgi:hypothetical protein
MKPHAGDTVVLALAMILTNWAWETFPNNQKVQTVFMARTRSKELDFKVPGT